MGGGDRKALKAIKRKGFGAEVNAALLEIYSDPKPPGSHLRASLLCLRKRYIGKGNKHRLIYDVDDKARKIKIVRFGLRDQIYKQP